MSLQSWASVLFGVLVGAGLEGLRWAIFDYPLWPSRAAAAGLLAAAVLAALAWRRAERWRAITDAQRAQELQRIRGELDQAVQELAHSEQLAATGAVAAPLCDRLQELVGQLTAAGAEAATLAPLKSLLDQFAELSRDRRRAMRPVDLAALVQQVVDDTPPDGGRRPSLVRPAEPVWVKGNPHRLALAVRHFLTHAASTSSGEPVMVVLTVAPPRASLAIASARRGDEQPGAEQATLHWQIAQAAVVECGGELAMAAEPGSLVLWLRLPLSRRPRLRRGLKEPVRARRATLRQAAVDDQLA